MSIIINQNELSEIIKEETEKFKKRKIEERKRDQFAHKFSNVFVEAIDPESDKEQIQESVYSFLKKYTSKENGGITYIVDKTPIDGINTGLKILEKQFSKLEKMDEIEKAWLLEGFNIIKECAHSISKSEPLNENLSQKLERPAPDPSLAMAYVQAYAKKQGYPWHDFKIQRGTYPNCSTVQFKVDRAQPVSNYMDVWWVYPGDYGYKDGASISDRANPNDVNVDARLYGEW